MKNACHDVEINTNPDLSVAELEALCQSFFNQRDCVDSKKAELKIEQGQLEHLERKVLAYFDMFGFAKKHIKGMGTLALRVRSSVKVPRGEENREAFFNYLKSHGIFDHLITVNSQTLNAWYNEQLENAQAQGEISIQIPGLEEPSLYQTLTVRRD